MTTGLDTKEFGEIIARHRDSLYPETVTIDLAAAERVAQTLIVGGLLKLRRRSIVRAARHLDRRRMLNRLVRVRDLSISYGGEPVLEGASIEVGQGQFVSLVGPSGSGKSSLLRAVIGLQKPLAGTVDAGRQAVRSRHAVPGRRAAAVEDGARQRRARPHLQRHARSKSALVQADYWLDRLGLAGFERPLSAPPQRRAAQARRARAGAGA